MHPYVLSENSPSDANKILRLSLSDFSIPLHATRRAASWDFRGWASLPEVWSTLRRSQALTLSLINSTRPRQSESRVCGYRPGYSLHLRIHKGQAYIPCLMRRAALRERTSHQQPHLSRRICTRDTDADNLNAADRCPLVSRPTYDREDGSVSRPLLSRDYDLVSPKAGYRSDGSTFPFFFSVIN